MDQAAIIAAFSFHLAAGQCFFRDDLLFLMSDFKNHRNENNSVYNRTVNFCNQLFSFVYSTG